MVGGTPIEGSDTATGSYWGSAGNMPTLPVSDTSPKILEDSSSRLAELLETVVSPVDRDGMEQASVRRSSIRTSISFLGV